MLHQGTLEERWTIDGGPWPCRSGSWEAAAVIPSKRNRVEPRAHDADLYKDRNKVECLIGRVKQYRRVATRYEKTARNYLAMLHLVSAMVWLL